MAEGLVVISKLGILGSEPLGLYEAIAKHLDADHHSPIDVHNELFSGQNRKDTGYKVTAELLKRTDASLREGFSVVYDSYVNNPETLVRLADVASNVGALLLPVHIRTDIHESQKNLSRRYKRNQLDIPAAETSYIEQARIATSMHKYLMQPGIHPDSNGTQHLCFGPEVTTEAVIDRIDTVRGTMQGSQV